MKHRILLFEKDKYIERYIKSAAEEVDAFTFKEDESGRKFLVLPSCYEAVSTKGVPSVSIGCGENSSIRLLGNTQSEALDAPSAVIFGSYIESREGVYINGKKTGSSKLIPGDKILVGNCELIYHEGWLDICGLRGETFETDLISKTDKPERFKEFPNI